MTYSTLIQELFARRKRTRDEINQAAELLGNPHLAYKTVHIAGTNGKGSVTTKIAKALEYAGYKVGLFTSPHIERFTERIQVNSVEISEEDVERLLAPLLTQFPDFCFFDYTTLLAFQYFKEQKVDYAVFEAGIGGLHDTTNVIQPIVSVITSISLDHREILGDTHEEIAAQKAGIIKSHTPSVIGPKARYKAIYSQAERMKSPLYEVASQEGGYDRENQAIARKALELIAIASTDAIEKGLQHRPPCRFERRGKFVLDVAHNPEGFENLIKTWDYYYPGKPLVSIVGLSSDKDLGSCLRLLAQRAQHLFLISAETKRAATLAQLEEILKQEKFKNYTACSSIDEALALASAESHDVLVCGSFYIMKEILRQIRRDNLALIS